MQIPNESIGSLKVKARTSQPSRVVSANKRLKMEEAENKSFLSLQQPNDNGDEDEIMYNPENGKHFKYQYNEYLKSMNYQRQSIGSKSQFRYQDKDANVYNRLWQDINTRSDKTH